MNQTSASLLPVYYCKALQGESNYNLCINADMTVSCNCQDYDGTGHLGDLDTHTFAEIFYGPIAQKFRATLAAGSMPIGACQGCSDFAVGVFAERPRYLTAFHLPVRGIMVENTSACNLRCIACRRPEILSHRKKLRMSLEDIAKVAAIVKDLGIRMVCFFNLGEPFLVGEIYEQMQLLRNENPDTTIVTSTNGALINTADKHQAALLMDFIYFSIDGTSQESLEKYQVGGNFAVAVDNMRALVRLRDERKSPLPFIEWKYVVFAWNDSDADCTAAIELARNAGADAISFWVGGGTTENISRRFPRAPFFQSLGEPFQLGRRLVFNAPAEKAWNLKVTAVHADILPSDIRTCMPVPTAAAGTEHLTRPDRHTLKAINIDLTGECGLNCTYCTRHDAGGGTMPQHMASATWQRSLSFCREMGTKNVHLCATGEVTKHPGWMDVIGDVLREGMNVYLASNFAMRLTPKEAAVLVRCSGIDIGIDTPDPDLLARIRSGLRVDTIAYNMNLVRATAAYSGLPCPPMTWTCVLTDLVADDVAKLAAFAVGCRAAGLTFTPLQKPDRYHGDAQPDWVTMLEWPRLAALVENLQAAVDLFNQNKMSITIPPALLGDITIAVGAGHHLPESPRPEIMQLEFADNNVSWSHTLKPVAGETRHCLVPWQEMTITANGSLLGCGYVENMVGSLDDGRSAEQIYNGPEMQALRTSLLRGELRQICRACPRFEPMPVTKYREAIAEICSNS